MSNALTSVLIDNELRKEAKELGVNISEFLNESLRVHLSNKKTEGLEEIVQYLEENDAKLHKYLDQVKQELSERKREKELEDAMTIEAVERCPELMGLKEHQVKNTKFLMDLIGVVREKHNVSVGVRQIRVYYDIKGYSGDS